MGIMSDEDYADLNAALDRLRKHRNLWGYTRTAVRAAILEIREGQADQPESNIKDAMLGRADELEHDLEFLELQFEKES